MTFKERLAMECPESVKDDLTGDAYGCPASYGHEEISRDENKQEILDKLLPALQATRNLQDLKWLRYDAVTETVIASFENGIKLVNVMWDSGTAMIRDVIAEIV